MTPHDSQQEELAPGRRLLLRHPPGLEDAQRDDLEQAIRKATEFQNSLAGQCDQVRLITELVIDDSGFWVREDPPQAAALETLIVQGAMDPGIVARYGVQLCNALIDTCYRESEPPRPHGALRPLCVFVADDRILVSEFGLAPALSRIIARDAAQEELDLLAPYTARELWQNPGAYGELRDLFAIGVMLYELTTGCHPFGAKRDDFEHCLERLQMGTNQPALVNRPTLEPGLAEVLDRAVARSEADRFESIRTLRDALIPFCTSQAAPSSSDSGRTEAIEASLDDQRAAFEQLCAPLRAGIYPQARVTTPLHRPASELVATILCFSTDEGEACIELPLRWDAVSKCWQEQKPGSLTEACVERAGAELQIRLQQAVIEPSALFSRHAQLLHFEFDRPQFEGEFPSVIRRAGALLYQRPGSGEFQALGKIDSQFPFELSKELARQARQAETTFEQVIQADKVKSAQALLEELSAVAAPAAVCSEPKRLKNLPDEVGFTLEAAGTRETLRILWAPDQGAFVKEPDWAAKLLRFQSGKSSAVAMPPKPVLATLLTWRQAGIAMSALLVLVVMVWIFWPKEPSLAELKTDFAFLRSQIEPSIPGALPDHAALQEFLNEKKTDDLKNLLEQLKPLCDPERRPAEQVKSADTLASAIDAFLQRVEDYSLILGSVEGATENQILQFEKAGKAWPTEHVATQLHSLKVNRILGLLKVAVQSGQAAECSKAEGDLEEARQFARDDGLANELVEEMTGAKLQIEKACAPAPIPEPPDAHEKAQEWLTQNHLPPPREVSHDELLEHLDNDVIGGLKQRSQSLETALRELSIDQGDFRRPMTEVKATFDGLLQQFQDYNGRLKLPGKSLSERQSLLKKAKNAWATAEITEQLETHLHIIKLLEATAEKAGDNRRCALSLLKQAREQAELVGMTEAFENQRDEIRDRYKEGAAEKLQEAENWLDSEAGELPEKWEDRLAAVANAEKAREFLDSLDHCPGDFDEDGLDYCVIGEANCPDDERNARELIAKLLAWTTVDLPITGDAGEPVTIALTFIPRDADGIIRKPFWMSQTEITVGQYRAIAKQLTKPKRVEKELFEPMTENDQHPIGFVTPLEATGFCAKLEALLDPQAACRLPSGNEWRHAWSTGRIDFHDAHPGLSQYDRETCQPTLDPRRANFDSAERKAERFGTIRHKDGFGHYARVGQYPPNRWLLYDMFGNVAEWIKRDGESYETLGGSFQTVPPKMDKEHPSTWNPGKESPRAAVGFRIVVEPPKPAEEKRKTDPNGSARIDDQPTADIEAERQSAVPKKKANLGPLTIRLSAHIGISPMLMSYTVAYPVGNTKRSRGLVDR